jgi:uncharacterized membrane protein YsdA (DUF1294 family)/cold shock CspA family protein
MGDDMSSGADHARRRGTLVDWNDERGFGFISPADGGSRVFVHVSAFPRGRRPSGDCEITYVEHRDERGRPRAAQVHYSGGAPRSRSGGGTEASLVVAALFFVVLVGLVALNDLPLLAPAAYGVLSVFTFLLYSADKSAARHGRWRTSESTLHTFGLAGGWPGALVARHALRHKTRKQPFRTVFWVTVVVNCLALAWVVVERPF